MDRQRLARRFARIAAAAAVLLLVAGPMVAAPAAAADPVDQTEETGGVIVRWNRVSQTYQGAAPEQAAALFQELQRTLEDGLAAQIGLETGSVAVKTMNNGLRVAPVPARFLNLSFVRVDQDGSFAGLCTQGENALHAASSHHPETTGAGDDRPLR